MTIKKLATLVGALAALAILAPTVLSVAATVSNGLVTDLGVNTFLTDFGMVTGLLQFKLGNFVWPASEIWLVSEQIDPDIFSKGLSQQTILEIPANTTWSTCRTAVYLNKTVGYGFKIYNTGTTAQILGDGTFCGLAYNGTYFVYGKY